MSGIQINRRQSLLVLAAPFTPAIRAQTNQKGKRAIDDCLAALGGPGYLAMHNRLESGRAYSFYRETLSGLDFASIYTQYDATPAAVGKLAVREREVFGKKRDYSVLFTETEAFDITYRGARPVPKKTFDRYKETTIRNFFYILRMRLHEPGMTFEWRSSDVLDNRPVDIVDVTDSNNLTTTIYIDQTYKTPLRQIVYRRDPVTRDRDEELTVFSKYRDVGGGVQWPYAIQRNRNGEKIYEIFSDSVKVNEEVKPGFFDLPEGIKKLKEVD